MRASVGVLLTMLVGNAAAQLPGVPTDAKATTGSQGTAPRQSTDPSRHQFFSPVMGIQIEAQGVTLPKGVADEPIVAPPAQQPAAQGTADQKPAEPEPPAQK